MGNRDRDCCAAEHRIRNARSLCAFNTLGVIPGNSIGEALTNHGVARVINVRSIV